MESSHKLFTSETFKAHTAFWKDAFRQTPADFLARPHWRSPPHGPGTPAPGSMMLSDKAANRVVELAKRRDLGIFVIVAAALMRLAQGYSGTHRVQIDTAPLAVGDRSRLSGDTVPLLIDLEPRASIRQWVKRVSQMISASYSYQNFPFADIPRVLLERPRPPRTNILLHFSNIHGEQPPAGDYDWVISLERDPGLSLKIMTLNGEMPAEFPPLLGRQLLRLCEGLDDLDQPVSAWSALEDEDKQRHFLAALASNREDFPEDRTIHSWFESQAVRLPAKAAVRTPTGTLSYRDLNASANRLAHYLVNEYGLRPGETAALLCDRSELAIVALLAILKAGGVYLPLDAGFPAKRLRFMLQDAGARVLLVHSNFLQQLAGLYETPMFALDLQLSGLETSRSDPAIEMTPGAAAYLIYTSGSTGRPKGVVIEHRAFVNMISHHLRAFHMGETDRVSQFYRLAFDSSMFEIFSALLSGATLFMATREIIEDAVLFAENLARNEITVLTLPPVYLNALDRARLQGVKTILTAGDVARPEDAVFYAASGAYFNSYGPTEATVCASHFRVEADEDFAARIPIGRAIGNTAMLLMDAELRPVATGMMGEICIGGVGLARGYLKRQDQTAAAFVPDPFQQGARLYKTGDLAVMPPGGMLELIGRADHQVKIRGFRIELGEIEAELCRHTGVGEAAVLARPDAAEEKRLLAFVTPENAPPAEELRRHLLATLPEFMVPATFVYLARMPLTANGKIDREALPEPERPGAAEKDYHAPRTATEQALASVWSEVLGVEQPGIHDNFFELGGDSILIIQMVARAHRAGIKLIAKQLTEYQTIAELARVAQDATTVEAEPGPVAGPLPPLPIQRWFFAQKLAQPHHYNQSVLLKTPPDVDVAALKRSWADLCCHHDGLRLRLADADTLGSPRIDEPGREPAFFVEALAALEERAAFHQGDFNLRVGPLARLVLFQDGRGRCSRMLLVIHHLLVDGVSWRILVEDFLTLYRQHIAGQTPNPLARTTALRRWATRLEDYRIEDAAEIDYWRNLALRPTPRVPTDFDPSRTENRMASSAIVRTELEASLTRSLLREAARAYHTQINDLLLAALLLATADWSGEPRLLLELESHGREDLFEDVDLTRTVGWFTALYPVYLEFEPGSGMASVIKSVKETLRAVPRNGFGHGVLTHGTAGEGMAPTASSKILFNYLGQTDRVLADEREWGPAEESRGPEQSPQNNRSHWLEVSCMVNGGVLKTEWVFSRELHRDDTIQRLAEGFRAHLESLIRHCLIQKEESFTPSDFPDAQLDQETLDGLIAKIKS